MSYVWYESYKAAVLETDWTDKRQAPQASAAKATLPVSYPLFTGLRVSITDQYKSALASIIDTGCTSVRTVFCVQQSNNRNQSRVQSPHLPVNYRQGQRNGVLGKEKHDLRSRRCHGRTIFYPRGQGATQCRVRGWERSESRHFERRRLLWRRRSGWSTHPHVMRDSLDRLRAPAC